MSDTCSVIVSGMSFTRIRYSNGERADPCGVPAFMCTSREVELPTVTESFRSVKKELISRTSLLGSLRVRCNL